MEEKDYDSEIINACNYELRKKSFDDNLRIASYKVATSIKKRAGKAQECKHCMACDMTKRTCILTMAQRVEQKRCWKAHNEILRIKGGLYGEKTNTQK